MKITAKVITDKNSKTYGRIGFSRVLDYDAVPENPLLKDAKSQERLDEEINRIVRWILNNNDKFQSKENRGMYYKKPNNILKLELLLYIKYGQKIEVEY